MPAAQTVSNRISEFILLANSAAVRGKNRRLAKRDFDFEFLPQSVMDKIYERDVVARGALQHRCHEKV